jgi:DNA-binding CsgD family transcriptional regulator
MDRSRDYQRLLDLVVGILEHPQPARPWPLVLTTLTEQLDGTGAIVSEVATAMGNSLVHAAVPAPLDRLAPLLDPCVPDDPLIQHYLSTGDRTPHTTDEVVDLSAWRGTMGYALVRDTVGARSCVSIPLTSPAGSHRGVTVTLPELSLAERHRDYLHGLQHLLTALDSHLRHLERWHRQLRDQRPAPVTAQHGITPREATVIALLADTLTAAAIARKLHISTRTVHKHLENIYRKLGTADRLETVLRARALGLLPPH